MVTGMALFMTDVISGVWQKGCSVRLIQTIASTVFAPPSLQHLHPQQGCLHMKLAHNCIAIWASTRGMARSPCNNCDLHPPAVLWWPG